MRRLGLISITPVLSVALVVLFLMLNHSVVAELDDVSPVAAALAEMPMAETGRLQEDSASSHDGYVFRFSPKNKAFNRFNLPTTGANPHSVTVISNVTNLEVWFTEPGADQIGRLVYTATNEFKFHEYPVPAGSEPLNLVNDVVHVWFTAREGNYIGRMRTDNGTLEAFNGLPSGSRPSGIAIAPNGSIWFTQIAADQIAQLVVRTPSDYDINEYVIPQFPGMPGESGPYGIAVEGDDKVWFAETVRNQLVRLQPLIYPFDPVGAFAQTGSPQKGGGVPFNLIYSTADGRLWFTELLGNRVTLLNVSTLSMGLQFDVPTGYSRPYDLAVDSARRVWFSEQSAGKLGRLVLTSTAAFEEYLLPLPNVKPQGVTVDPHGNIWLVASAAPVPTDVVISGPITGTVDTTHSFTATVHPMDVEPPIAYVWQATGLPTITNEDDISNTVTFSWMAPGSQTITVTATSVRNTVTDTHAITISEQCIAAADITKTATPLGQVEFGDTLTYTAIISAPEGTRVGFFDPLEGTVFSRFAARPSGITHDRGDITGTLTVAPGNQVTVAFVVGIAAPLEAGLIVPVTNRACVFPASGTIHVCVWSNEVTNLATRLYNSYLPLVVRNR